MKMSEFVGQDSGTKETWTKMDYSFDLCKVVLKYRGILSPDDLKDGMLRTAIVAMVAEYDGSLDEVRERVMENVEMVIEGE